MPRLLLELDFARDLSCTEGMYRFLLVFLTLTASLFAQEVASKSAFSQGLGVNGEVLAIAIQPDGKVVIGGRFAEVNGVPRFNIARLNPDGTLDKDFASNMATGINGTVQALAIQPEGGIIVGGLFTQAGRSEIMNIARYNADGTVDTTFGQGGGGELGANGAVYALATQPDGKVVVGGNFSTIFGQPRRGIARLNGDGTLDGPVVPQNAVSGSVRATAAGADNSFIAGGQFTLENQNARNLLKVSAPAE